MPVIVAKQLWEGEFKFFFDATPTRVALPEMRKGRLYLKLHACSLQTTADIVLIGGWKMERIPGRPGDTTTYAARGVDLKGHKVRSTSLRQALVCF